MSDIAEGIGSSVEGALLGRAVEPERGEAERVRREASTDACLNCGALARDAYCPRCGQKTRLHRTLSAIGHDLLHGVLHLDGKLFKTLPLLAFKPGQLTRRYIEGERADFVSPMAMFLFSVFAMFAVFQAVGIGVPGDLDVGSNEQTASEIAGEREALEAEKAQLEQERETADAPGERGSISGEISGINAQLRALEVAARTVETPDDAAIVGSAGAESARSLQEPQDRMEGSGQFSSDIDLPFFEKLADKWNKNPSLMLYKLQANGYKFSWLLIPLSIPFVWLLFVWKRGFKAYDHAIFVTYSLAFMSLLFIALSLAGVMGVPTPVLGTIATFAPPIHIYRQLRGTYGLSRFSAIWRLFALSFFIVLVTALFLQALLLLGAF